MSKIYDYFLNSIFIILFFFFVILVEPISIYYTNIVSFGDEIVVLILFIWALFKIIITGDIVITYYEKVIYFLFFLIVYIGLLGSFFYELNTIKALFIDFFAFSKFMIVYFSVRIIFEKFDYLKFSSFNSNIFASLIFLLLMVLLTNLFFNFFPIYEKKFFIEAQLLFFGHPSKLAFACIMLFSALFPISKSKFTYLALSIGVFSMRAKFFLFAILSLVGMFFLNHKWLIKYNFKSIIFFLFSIIIVLFVFQNKIIFYFSEESLENGYARAVLLYNSFLVAYDFFPLGSGFGTFASWASGEEYSKLYTLLNIEHIWGITEEKYNFISDSYLSMIIAQFGFFGLLLFIIFLLFFLIQYINYYNYYTFEVTKRRLAMIGIVLLLYVFTAETLADSILSQNRGVFIFIYLAIISNILSKDVEDIKKKGVEIENTDYKL